MNQVHVVIVGGGITGLSVAHRLVEWSEREGGSLRCTLLEESRRFGGKIRTYRDESGVFAELGPDSIYTHKQAGMELIRALDLQDQLIYAATSGGTYISREGVFHSLPDGMFSAIPGDVGAFAKTSLLSPAGKFRALCDLFLPGRPLEDDVALGSFLRRRLGKEFVENMASPLLAGIHAGDIDRLSLETVAPMLRQLYQRYGSLMRGALIERPRRMDRGSAPRSPFASLAGGLEALVDHLVLRLSGRVALRLGAHVAQVRRHHSGSFDVMVREGKELSSLRADAVVLAVPAYAASDILVTAGIHPGLLRSIRYVSTATVLLGYDQPADRLGLRGTGFLIPASERSRFSAVTVVSNKWPGSAANRFGVMVRGYIGRDGDDTWTRLDNQELVELFIHELRIRFGVVGVPPFGKITRWQSAMPQYEVGHRARVEQIEHQLAAAPGLYVAGSAYRGMGIPDCIADGVQTAQKVARFLEEGGLRRGGGLPVGL